MQQTVIAAIQLAGLKLLWRLQQLHSFGARTTCRQHLQDLTDCLQVAAAKIYSAIDADMFRQ